MKELALAGRRSRTRVWSFLAVGSIVVALSRVVPASGALLTSEEQLRDYPSWAIVPAWTPPGYFASRQDVLDNLPVFRPYGANENFALHSQDALIAVCDYLETEWATTKPIGDGSHSRSDGRYWFTPLRYVFQPYVTLHVFFWNGTFINRVCGNFTPVLLNPPPPNHPPVAEAGPDQTVEQTSAAGTEVTLDATGSWDPDGDNLTYEWDTDADGQYDDATGPTPQVLLNLGQHQITLRVADPGGLSDTDGVVVTVVDTTPPHMTFTQLEHELWPPNHKMHLCATVSDVYDICDAEPVVDIKVTGNEPINGDWEVVRNGSVWEVWLRAEYTGRGSGRDYYIDVTVTDFSGNQAKDSGTVTVPHDQGKKPR